VLRKGISDGGPARPTLMSGYKFEAGRAGASQEPSTADAMPRFGLRGPSGSAAGSRLLPPPHTQRRHGLNGDPNPTGNRDRQAR